MMKKNMKKYSVIKRTVCIILIIGCIITGVYSYYGGLGTGKCAGMDAEELEKIWNQDEKKYTDGYTAEQREKIIEDHPIEVIED